MAHALTDNDARDEDHPGHPTGAPILWSADELDEMSRIGPEDLAAAEAFWRRAAPEWAKGLLRADRR